MITTIAETIIWLAEERQKDPKYKGQNINSQVHAVKLEVTQKLMEYMDLHKGEKR